MFLTFIVSNIFFMLKNQKNQKNQKNPIFCDTTNTTEPVCHAGQLQIVDFAVYVELTEFCDVFFLSLLFFCSGEM